MNKLIQTFVVITILLLCLNVVSSAKSSLTYFDTAVLQSQYELSREQVLSQVVSEAEKHTGNLIVNQYQLPTSSQFSSSLKQIISKATNTFFQK